LLGVPRDWAERATLSVAGYQARNTHSYFTHNDRVSNIGQLRNC